MFGTWWSCDSVHLIFGKYDSILNHVIMLATHTGPLHPSYYLLSAQLTGVVEYTDCISAERYDPPNKCSRYDIKQSYGEALALKLQGMWSIPSLPLLPGPHKPGVVAPNRLLFMGQIELFDI